MSERESDIGPFLLGIALGAVLGVLFAPERGEHTRRRLKRRMGDWRETAERKAEALVERVSDAIEGDSDVEETDGEEASAGADTHESRGARAELERRLAEARRRRRLDRSARGRRVPPSEDEEDEPVA